MIAIKSYRLTRGKDGVLRKVHRIKAEAALGRPLPPRAEIHHADGTCSENSVLVICEDSAYHRLLHVRMRIVRAGGDPNVDALCSCCKKLRRQVEFNKNRKTRLGLCPCCKSCGKEYWRTTGGPARRRKRLGGWDGEEKG
jgi:hypothetical protein